MMRSLLAAAAAVFFGAGVESVQAQCKCDRTGTTATTGQAPTTKASYVPPGTTEQHHATTAAPKACCAESQPPKGTVTSSASPISGCSHCAVSQTATTNTAGGTSDKEVTLTGTMMCAKCGLKEPGVKTCTNAIQVKDGDKTITYFLEDKGSGEEYHDGLCGGGTKSGVKVTGTVTEKDGKRLLKVTKVEEKK